MYNPTSKSWQWCHYKQHCIRQLNLIGEVDSYSDNKINHRLPGVSPGLFLLLSACCQNYVIARFCWSDYSINAIQEAIEVYSYYNKINHYLTGVSPGQFLLFSVCRQFYVTAKFCRSNYSAFYGMFFLSTFIYSPVKPNWKDIICQMFVIIKFNALSVHHRAYRLVTKSLT